VLVGDKETELENEEGATDWLERITVMAGFNGLTLSKELVDFLTERRLSGKA
jgi:hypothetical protein